MYSSYINYVRLINFYFIFSEINITEYDVLRFNLILIIDKTAIFNL